MFKINGLQDGNSDLGLIMGQDGSFAEDLIYQYDGDNFYIDRLEPIDNAFELFRNQVPSYCNAVALDEGTYKTVGCSFELGGLADNQNTREELIILILEFFGGILTEVDENDNLADEIDIETWPNPFNEQVNFRLKLEQEANISIGIYNLNGQKVFDLAETMKSPGIHTFSWAITTGNTSTVSDGMFIYRIAVNGKTSTGKIIYITK
jgi:hypothetical protein